MPSAFPQGSPRTSAELRAVRDAARELTRSAQDYRELLELAGAARLLRSLRRGHPRLRSRGDVRHEQELRDEVVSQLAEMTRRAGERAQRGGHGEPDELFYAEQNARLVKNAEQYYRTMFRGRASSWNVRDSHMVETLQALDRHLGRQGGLPRMAVWAHNSHLGDASATEMVESGEWNVGQLVRQRYGAQALLIGFSTDRGTVKAASHWGANAERKRVRPGLAGSYEALFHEVGAESFLLTQRNDRALANAFRHPLLQRAIGVIYRPETERSSHYFDARLARQFDAMIHLDRTRALVPLERGPQWLTVEAPETYPTGV